MTHPVMDSALKTTEPCQVHTAAAHVPVSHLNHHHHVWPLSLGGPDVPENVIIVCPTGHYNIHTLLNEYITCGGVVPWSSVRCYAFGEREYAQLGYQRYVRGSL